MGVGSRIRCSRKESPDEIVVVDASGEYTAARIAAAATELAALLDTARGGSPTVLVQADNSWRTLTAALAVGLRGGVVAVFSRHATPSEFAVALHDIAPDVVIADPGSLRTGARRTTTSAKRRPRWTAGRCAGRGHRSATSHGGTAESRSR